MYMLCTVCLTYSVFMLCATLRVLWCTAVCLLWPYTCLLCTCALIVRSRPWAGAFESILEHEYRQEGGGGTSPGVIEKSPPLEPLEAEIVPSIVSGASKRGFGSWPTLEIIVCARVFGLLEDPLAKLLPKEVYMFRSVCTL